MTGRFTLKTRYHKLIQYENYFSDSELPYETDMLAFNLKNDAASAVLIKWYKTDGNRMNVNIHSNGPSNHRILRAKISKWLLVEAV